MTALGRFVRLREFAQIEHALEHMCSHAAARIGKALEEKGRAHLILSGGKSPERYLPMLASKLGDWSGVVLSLSDERWVPIDYESSNQGMIERVFVPCAPRVTLRGMMGVGRNAAADAERASRAYGQLTWPADVGILGIGSDGHVASLFPRQSCDTCKKSVIVAHDGSGNARLSMSPGMLLDAGMVYVLVNGELKRAALERAMQRGPFEEAPIRCLLFQDVTAVECILC